MTSCVAGSPNCHFSCPNGGTWFVCETAPYFVGCCSSDPCGNTSTPACPDLYPASFNTSVYSNITANTCLDGPASNWYTCSYTDPPFIGCCSSSACTDGCPADDLLPAAWSSSRREQYTLFADNTDTTTTDTASSVSSSSGLSPGAIAGIAIGVAAAVGILVAAFFFLRRRKRRPTSMAGLKAGYQYDNHASPYQDAGSHLSSPVQTTKYPSDSSSSYPFLPSPIPGAGSHRPISELRSDTDDNPSPINGLNFYGPHTGAPTISELDSESPSLPDQKLLPGPPSPTKQSPRIQELAA